MSHVKTTVHFITKRELADCLFDFVVRRDAAFLTQNLQNCSLRAASTALFAAEFNDRLGGLSDADPVFAIEVTEIANASKGGDA